jgi:hypothetical protein
MRFLSFGASQPDKILLFDCGRLTWTAWCVKRIKQALLHALTFSFDWLMTFEKESGQALRGDKVF